MAYGSLCFRRCVDVDACWVGVVENARATGVDGVAVTCQKDRVYMLSVYHTIGSPQALE